MSVIKKVTSIALIVCVLTSGLLLVSCDNKLPASKGVIFEYFKSNVVDVLVGKKTEVTFSAKLINNNKIEELSLISNDKEIGNIYDNGKGADKKQGDGIYTGIFTLFSEAEKYQDYYAEYKNIKSNPINFFYYTNLTDDDYKKFNSTVKNINSIQAKYLNDSGYVKNESYIDLLNEISNYTKDQYQKGNITKYVKNDTSIYMVMKSGIGYLYMPPKEDVLSVGSSCKIAAIETSTETYKTLTYKSAQKKVNLFLEDQCPESVSLLSIPKTATEIAKLNGYSYSEIDDSLKNEEVTVDSLKTLAQNIGNYKVLIWLGHGGYNTDVGSALVTGEEATFSNNIGKYSNDLKREPKRLVTTNGWQTLGTDFIACKYAATSHFFDYYLSDINDALIYLGACESGKDENLAKSFVSKGANTVYAYSEQVPFDYEMKMRTTTFAALIYADNASRTAQETLNYAKSICGSPCNYDVNLFKNVNVELKLFGEGTFVLGNIDSTTKKDSQTSINVTDELKNESTSGETTNNSIHNDYSGACCLNGVDVTWALNTETGELILKGSGSIETGPDEYSIPWYKHKSLIKTVVIDGDILGINPFTFPQSNTLTNIIIKGNNSYYSCVDGVLFNKNKTELIYYPTGRKATQYSIPQGTKTISQLSFSGGTFLKKVIIPESVTRIDDYSFLGCSTLGSVVIPKSTSNIGTQAFQRTKISAVTINKNCIVEQDAFPAGCKINYYASSSAISKEQAENRLKKEMGEVDSETGFKMRYDYIQDKTLNGKDYYCFQASTFVDNNHWCTLGYLYVPTDGVGEIREDGPPDLI